MGAGRKEVSRGRSKEGEKRLVSGLGYHIRIGACGAWHSRVDGVNSNLGHLRETQERACTVFAVKKRCKFGD